MDIKYSFSDPEKKPLLKAFLRSEFSIEQLEPRILLDAAAAVVAADAVEAPADPGAADAASASAVEADAQAQADANAEANLANQVESAATSEPTASVAPAPVAQANNTNTDNSNIEQNAASSSENTSQPQENQQQPLTHNLENELNLFSVKTDKDDYMPGSKAVITVEHMTPGATVEIQVLHVSDPGVDGIYGTLDDVLDLGPDGEANTEDDGYGETGAGHDPFTVTDGHYEITSFGQDGIEGTADDIITGDLDKTENGTIVTEWYVNPDDSLGATFLLTANEISTPGEHSISESTLIVQTASASFTDAFPEPVQTYYVPLPESDLNTSFNAIHPNAEPPITSIVSIAVAGPNTVIYYDHWEDGYEADVTNPQQSTTLIWGDGNAANGVAPNTGGTDIFSGGESIILQNNVDLPRDSSDILFDGGDRIQTSYPIAVTRGAYPDNAGSLFAGGVEVLDTDSWGDSFVVPVGENTNSNTNAFQYTSAYVMAQVNGTQIFLNGVLKTTLDQGQNYVLNDLRQGDAITTSSGKNVQVHLITGDVGATYEMRWYSMLPRDQWSNDYYSPVAEETGSTGFWFFNPNNQKITINYDHVLGGNIDGSFTINANSSKFIEVDSDGDINLPSDFPHNNYSGIRFFSAGGQDFYALAQIDADSDNQGDSGARYDWGFPLIPAEQLTSQALVGWGYGNTSDNPSESSRSVVWVTPVSNANIHIDYNGDGTVDNTISAVKLQSIRITDNLDQNMSGAIIYATNNQGNPVNIAVAWGQDPHLSDQAKDQPNDLDLGTVIFPLPSVEASKSVTLTTDNDGDGLVDPGDSIQFTITIVNSGFQNIGSGGYTINDFTSPILDNANYVLNSTVYTFNNGANSINVSDSSSGTPFPLDNSSFTNSDTLSAGETQTLTFLFTVKGFDQIQPGTTSITNEGELLLNGKKIDIYEATIPLDFDANITIEKSTNGVDADTDTGPFINVGDEVTWTYVVTNTGQTDLADVSLVDDQLGTISTIISKSINADNILDIGETWTYQATGIAAAGQYSNLGTVTAKPVYSDGITEISGLNNVSADDSSHYFGADPKMIIDKTVVHVDGEGPDASADEAGDVITYNITVTNTGNVTLTNVNVIDPLLEDLVRISDDIGNDDQLGVGESWAYIGTYAVTQADLDNANTMGQIENTATADSNETDPVSDTATVSLLYDPGLNITKGAALADGGAAADQANDVINYTITVTNTGNITLTNVEVTDPLLQDLVRISDDIGNDGLLGIGETWTYAGTYTVTQADLDTNGSGDGNIDNTATANSDQTDDIQSSVETPILYNPNISIDKVVLGINIDADARTEAIPLTEAAARTEVLRAETAKWIELTEAARTEAIGRVDEAEATRVDVFGWIGAAEAARAEAVARAEDPNLSTEELEAAQAEIAVWTLEVDAARAEADALGTEIEIARAAADTLSEEIDASRTVGEALAEEAEVIRAQAEAENIQVRIETAGDTITYHITITNTGNITLTNIEVNDPLLEDLAYVSGDDGDGQLGVDESWTYTGTYTVTQADIDSNGTLEPHNQNPGFIDNTATVDTTQTDTNSDDAATPLYYNPSITLVKTGTFNDDLIADNFAQAGETISYSFEIYNTGNVTLTNVTLIDHMRNVMLTPLTDEADNGISILAPGDSETATGNYTLTQEDIGNEFKMNVATVFGFHQNATSSVISTDDHVENLNVPTTTPEPPVNPPVTPEPPTTQPPTTEPPTISTVPPGITTTDVFPPDDFVSTDPNDLVPPINPISSPFLPTSQLTFENAPRYIDFNDIQFTGYADTLDLFGTPLIDNPVEISNPIGPIPIIDCPLVAEEATPVNADPIGPIPVECPIVDVNESMIPNIGSGNFSEVNQLSSSTETYDHELLKFSNNLLNAFQQLEQQKITDNNGSRII